MSCETHKEKIKILQSKFFSGLDTRVEILNEYKKLSECQLNFENHSNALDSINIAYKIADKIGLPREKGKSKYLEAKILLQMDNYENSAICCVQALFELYDLNSLHEKSLFHETFLMYCHILTFINDPHLFERINYISYEILNSKEEKYQFNDVRVRFLIDVALYFDDRGFTPTAEKIYDVIDVEFKRSQFKEIESTDFEFVDDVMYALEHFIEYSHIQRQLRNIEKSARCLVNAKKVLNKIEQLSSVEEVSKETSELIRLKAFYYRMRGNIHKDFNDFERALEYFKKSACKQKSLMRILPDSYILLNLYILDLYNIAVIKSTLLESKQDEFKSKDSKDKYHSHITSGIEIINEAIKLHEEQGNENVDVKMGLRLFLLKATQLKQCSRLKEAKEIYKKIISKKVKVNEKENFDIEYQTIIAETHHNYGNLFYKLGSYYEALNQHRQAISVIESVLEFGVTTSASLRRKIPVSYNFVIADMIEKENMESALALIILSRTQGTLKKDHTTAVNIQELLSESMLHHSFESVIFITSYSPSGILSAIVISHNKLVSSVIKTKDNGILDVDFSDQRSLVQRLWNNFDKDIRDNLISSKNIILSCDSHTNNLPWEGIIASEDNPKELGFIFAMPRVNCLNLENISKSIYKRKTCKSVSFFMPSDTKLPFLPCVREEVESLSSLFTKRGGSVRDSYQSLDANIVNFESLLKNQPDILYFSGHGEVIGLYTYLLIHGDGAEAIPFTPDYLRILCNSNEIPPPSTIILNCCNSAFNISEGGKQHDLTSKFLELGSDTIISINGKIKNSVSQFFVKYIFDVDNARFVEKDIGESVIKARMAIHEKFNDDSWLQVQLHGNPFKSIIWNKLNNE
jgi:tetratricopeptide (TPR) repeat protein